MNCIKLGALVSFMIVYHPIPALVWCVGMGAAPCFPRKMAEHQKMFARGSIR